MCDYLIIRFSNYVGNHFRRHGSQDVCELAFGVDVFDLDFGVQINSIEQPIKNNSVGPGNVSHCWTSAFHNHLVYSFIVLKHIQ